MTAAALDLPLDDLPRLPNRKAAGIGCGFFAVCSSAESG
jgi:hypothetical protein